MSDKHSSGMVMMMMMVGGAKCISREQEKLVEHFGMLFVLTLLIAWPNHYDYDVFI